MIDAPNGRRWLQLDEHFREVTCDGVVMLAPIIVARSQPEIISAVLRSDGRQCFAVVLMASESQGRLITVPSTVRFMHTHNWLLLLLLLLLLFLFETYIFPVGVWFFASRRCFKISAWSFVSRAVSCCIYLSVLVFVTAFSETSSL
jgi:hypothetical protein